MLLSPLEKFYEALSDEQRERFNAMNGSTEGARSPSDRQPCAVKRPASSTCQRNASNRWFN
jgi:hypothetical protein